MPSCVLNPEMVDFCQNAMVKYHALVACVSCRGYILHTHMNETQDRDGLYSKQQIGSPTLKHVTCDTHLEQQTTAINSTQQRQEMPRELTHFVTHK